MPPSVRSSVLDSSIDSEWLVNQIAHALRNPIFAATVQAEALTLKAGEDSGLAKSAAMVLSQLRRLEDDLEEMLLLGRPARLNPQPLDGRAIAARAAAGFRDGSAGDTADVQLRGETGALPLHSDETAIRIILERLLRNAIQHTEPPHAIEIEVNAVAGGGGAITVRDRGAGIHPELLDKIFLPFFPQHRGRPGLGLAVAAKFAHVLGGYLEVESEVDSGTTARLVLPAAVPEAPS